MDRHGITNQPVRLRTNNARPYSFPLFQRVNSLWYIMYASSYTYLRCVNYILIHLYLVFALCEKGVKLRVCTTQRQMQENIDMTKTFKPFHIPTGAQSVTIAKRTNYALDLAQSLGLLDPDTEAWIKARIEDRELDTRDGNARNNKLHCPNQYARFAFTDIKTAQKARKGGRLSLQHDSSSQFEKEYSKQ